MAKKKKKTATPPVPNTHTKPLNLEGELQAMPSARLRRLVGSLKRQLKIAERVLLDRQQLAEHLEQMTIGQLLQIISKKRPHWRFAQHILEGKRQRGEDFGTMSAKPEPGTGNLGQMPCDPASATGDWWRIHGD